MSENVHALIGIIELTSRPYATSSEVDDSTLEGVLASFAGHESLADELSLSTGGNDRARGWRRVGSDSLYNRRASVTADLAALVSDLEREYAELCESLG